MGERVEIEIVDVEHPGKSFRRQQAEQAQNRRQRGPKGVRPSERHKTRLYIFRSY